MARAHTLPKALPRENPLPWWPDWTKNAKCLEYDPEIFFDLGNGGRFNSRKINRAKRICFMCQVQRKCLRANLFTPYGVFGGTTPLDRLDILEHKFGSLRRGDTDVRGASEIIMRYKLNKERGMYG